MCLMIKLIVADCDGTILDDHKKIDNQLKEVIKKLEKRGIIFTLATGRNIFLMSEIIKELNLEWPYIVNNGANIYQKDNSIKSYTISQESINFVLRILENNNFPFLAYTETELYMNEKHELLEVFKLRLKDKLTQIEYDAKMDLEDREIIKVTIAVDDLDKIKVIKKEVDDKFPLINFKRSEGLLFSITSSEATKGNAIKTLASMFGINNDEIMVFGDNYNDITMFDVASVGVAMGNSDETIKQCATHETSDNNHHGVSEFLKKYFGL